MTAKIGSGWCQIRKRIVFRWKQSTSDFGIVKLETLYDFVSLCDLIKFESLLDSIPSDSHAKIFCCFHCAFEFHLEPNSPLWSIMRIYLQNQRLKSILDLASSPSSIGCRCNTLCTIQCEVEEDLFSTFYQLQMSKYADDLECYIKELTMSTNP